jgi:hypothetical protein
MFKTIPTRTGFDTSEEGRAEIILESTYFLLEKLKCKCFPKSGPRTIFGPWEFLIWSTRMKIVAILSKFGIKRVIFVEKLPIL